MKKALFAGSFDPPTYGHINIIERSLKLFDELIVAIAINSTKKNSLLSTQEKVDLLTTLFKNYKNIKIIPFDGLIVNLAIEKQVNCLIRSIKNTSELDFEFQLAFTNKKISSLETFFLMPDPKFSHISSTIVKEIAYLKGPLEHFIPKSVIKKINEKLSQ